MGAVCLQIVQPLCTQGAQIHTATAFKQRCSKVQVSFFLPQLLFEAGSEAGSETNTGESENICLSKQGGGTKGIARLAEMLGND